jgi:glutamate--cysteine ligase catalytic subunit
MGLLTLGTPLEWSEMEKWQDHVRKYGIQQFIRIYNRLKVIHYVLYLLYKGV